jgi:excisionase family DNA binding protein
MPKKSTLTPIAVGPLDAARLMGVSRSRIYELLNSGELPSYKDGRRRLILVADIEAWLVRLAPAPRPRRAPSEPPTGPLLPVEQQETAIARATEPGPDLAAVYSEHRKSLARSMGDHEAHFRAFDFAVSFCREHSACDLKEAKKLVRAAIAKAAAQ